MREALLLAVTEMAIAMCDSEGELQAWGAANAKAIGSLSTALQVAIRRQFADRLLAIRERA